MAREIALNQDAPLVSVVLPCLNEEEAIGACIEKIQTAFARANIHGEIVVCDNGSTDRSVAIAEQMGARVVHQPERGYGHAYLKGFAKTYRRALRLCHRQSLSPRQSDIHSVLTPLHRQPAAHCHSQFSLQDEVYGCVQWISGL
jgi:glycosyltransferase involved in cell wall biosynthesis